MSETRTPESLDRALFGALADGALHSGEALAERFGVTRGGVWKAIENLRNLGLPVDAVPKCGYQLAFPTAPLAVDAIRAALPPPVRSRLASCEVRWSAGSTNSLLLDAPAARVGELRVLLAENQTAGRGRRGRHWQAPLGSGLCLSIGFAVDALPRDFGGLTLALGLAALDALTSLGASGVTLKWPNDLVVGDAKLGGILTELRAEAGGPAWVVCGLGINVALPQGVCAMLAAAGVRATDLRTVGIQEDRNRLTARLIANWVAGIDSFLQSGMASVVARWPAHDALLGREITVRSPAGATRGRALGIDASGALRVATPAGEVGVIAGEVSVRAGEGGDP